MLKCDQLTIPKEKKMPQNMTAEEVFYLKQMAQKKPINIRNRNAVFLETHTLKILSEMADSSPAV